MRLKVSSELAANGIAPDAPSFNLPDGVWSDSRNVRYRDGAVEKVRGIANIFGSLSATALFCVPVVKDDYSYWVYGRGGTIGTGTVYSTNGTTHANIDGPVSLSAADDLNMTGGNYHGFVILNDGTSCPQSWLPNDLQSNNLTSLSAWPSDITARLVRPFKDFLFAADITTSAVRNQRLLRWSDAGAQGALPGSWDFTDPTNQAGITELGQNQDGIIELAQMRDSLMIYTPNTTWNCEYIQGADVFGFRQLFSQSGLLTTDCIGVLGPRHLVVTDSDIAIHDGQSVESIINERTRRWFFNRLSTTRYQRTFVVIDQLNREVLVCFPESGVDWPNLALVWNWTNNTWQPRDLGFNMSCGSSGFLPPVLPLVYDNLAGTIDALTGDIDQLGIDRNPAIRKTLFFNSAAKSAYQGDRGESHDGATMTAYATREGLSLTVADVGKIKRVIQVLPRIIGTTGDSISIYIGTRPSIDAAINWSGPYPFVIGVDYKIDCRLSGRVIDLRIEYAGSNTFRCAGFDVEFFVDGTR